MAKDEKPTDDDSGGEAPKKPAGSSSLKKILLISLGVVVLLGLSIGGTVLTMNLAAKPEPAKKTAKKKPAEAEGEEAEAKDEKEAAEEKPEGQDKADAEAEAEDDKNPDGSPKLAIYLDFDQPFVVNFQDEGTLRYLQITVSVMTKDQKVVDEVKRHMPLIRNNLVMLFTGLSRELVITRDGKEKIRKDAEAEVQKILTAQTGHAGIKSLYFTSFVIQ